MRYHSNVTFLQVENVLKGTQLIIEITNPLNKDVSVEVYSISGQKIKSLSRAQKEAKISLVWNGHDETGQQVPSGTYILKMNKESRQVIKSD